MAKITIKRIYERLFSFCKASGHFEFDYNPRKNTISLLEHGKPRRRFCFNLFFSTFFMVFHFWQTYRCLKIYNDDVTYLICLCWFNGYSMAVSGNVINAILCREKRLNMLQQLLKLQTNIFEKFPKCEERHARSCAFVNNAYYFMWSTSTFGQGHLYLTQPNFYSYAYSYVEPPDGPHVDFFDDPILISLFAIPEVYSMFLNYGHVVLSDILPHMGCDFVAQTLVSLSSSEEVLDNPKLGLESSRFENIARAYRELQLLTADITRSCGKMTFVQSLFNIIQCSTAMYGVIRFLQYLSPVASMLYWGNVIYFNSRYTVGWKSMANVKERSLDFLTFWRRHINCNSKQSRRERRLNLRILWSLRKIEYKIGWKFFAMSNFTLLNIMYMTSSNIILFLEADGE